MSPSIKMQWRLFQLLVLVCSFEENVNIGWFWKKQNKQQQQQHIAPERQFVVLSE